VVSDFYGPLQQMLTAAEEATPPTPMRLPALQ